MLAFVKRIIAKVGEDWSRIATMEVVETEAGPLLLTSARAGGSLSAWKVDADGVTAIGGPMQQTRAATGSVGTEMDLALVKTAAGHAIVYGAGGTGGLMVRAVSDKGTVGAADPLGAIDAFSGANLHQSSRITLEDGTQIVAGGLGENGIGILRFDEEGRFRGATTVREAKGEQVAATASIQVGEHRFLAVATGGTDQGLTLWHVGASGRLSQGDSLTPATGLWIQDATVLQAATVGGQPFLILGAAGSGSLSVVAVGGDGTLNVVDHVIDDLSTRFARVTALEVVEHAGGTYVLAAGADDGVSLFQLLPGGRLLHLATMADDDAASLADVSAIVAHGDGDGIRIFIASASEKGFTQFSYEPGDVTLIRGGGRKNGGRADDILQGGAGNDTLDGRQGRDILMDGSGVDDLQGGSGADVFIFSSDGDRDTIRDFQPGTDRIDISAWGLMRSLEQLEITSTDSGLTIRHGQEELRVISASGKSIQTTELALADLIDLTRIPVALPDLPPDREDTGGGAPLAGSDRNDRLYGSNGAEVIRGGGGTDELSGNGGDDTLEGQTGRDTLFGGSGADALLGGDAEDRLLGDDGNDDLSGGDGADLLEGGADRDRLHGEAGDDTLLGQDGHDTLFGGDGNDRAEGGADRDRLYGDAGDDMLLGQDDRDAMLGGGGSDQLWGGDGNDILKGGDANDTLWGDDGNDRLFGEDGANHIHGGAGNDRVWAGTGSDRVWGDEGNDTILGLGGHDRIFGGAGADRLVGRAGFDRLEGGTENDALFGGHGNDTLLGDDGIDRIFGGAHNDRIFGGAGNDAMKADAGHDVVYGGTGNDRIFGGAGNDRLIGNEGRDFLIGGAGRDYFIFRDAADSGATPRTRDTIKDHVRGQDRIDLRSLDGDISHRGDQRLDFVDGDFSGNGHGEVRIAAEGRFTRVEIDLDGDLHADMSILVEIGILGQSDFLL